MDIHVLDANLTSVKQSSNDQAVSRQSFKARVKLVGYENETLFVGGSVLAVGDHASRSLGTNRSAGAGRIMHEIRMVQQSGNFDAYFEHGIRSTFTDKRDKDTLHDTKSTAIFNAHNLIGDDGKPTRVSAVLLEPAGLTENFAKQWELKPQQVQMLRERMGWVQGKKAYGPQGKQEVWQIRLSVDCATPLGSALLANIDHNENEPAINKFRQAYQTCRHIDYLIGGTNLAYDIALMNESLAELAESDPYNNFWVNNRFPVQIKKSHQCFKHDDEPLPAEAVAAKLTFSKWEHYATTMAHGIMSQHAVCEDRANRFEADVCLFKITNDELFGYAIIPPGGRTSYSEGDRLKLHFPKESTDSRCLDLDAVVTGYTPHLNPLVLPFRLGRRYLTANAAAAWPADTVPNIIIPDSMTPGTSDASINLPAANAEKFSVEWYARTKFSEDLPYGAHPVLTNGADLRYLLHAIVISWQEQHPDFRPVPTFQNLHAIATSQKTMAHFTKSPYSEVVHDHFEQASYIIHQFCESKGIHEGCAPRICPVGPSQKLEILGNPRNTDGRVLFVYRQDENTGARFGGLAAVQQPVAMMDFSDDEQSATNEPGVWAVWPFDLESEVGDFKELSTSDAREHLRNTDKKIRVTVRPQVSLSPLERNLYSLRAMDMQRRVGSPNWMPVILGNNLLDSESRSFYSPLGPKADKYTTLVQAQHSDGQIIASQMLDNLRGRDFLITGHCGTGKSKFAIDLPLPMMMYRHIGNDPNTTAPLPIWFLSTSNVLADSTFEAIKERAAELLGKEKHPIIIRAMAWSTERQRFKYEAKLDLGLEKPARRADMAKSEDIKNDLTRDVVRLIHIAAEQKFDFIQDERFKDLNGTLAYWMLCFMGARGFACSYTNEKKYGGVLDLYIRYAMGEDLGQIWGSFRARTDELRDDVLRAADVIVTTTSNAAHPVFTKAGNPYAIVVDNANGVSEPDLLCLFGYYSHCEFRIQCGDKMQPKPLVHSPPKGSQCKAPFEQQMALSAFMRFLLNGVPSIDLKTTHRPHQEICDIISPVVYYDTLTIADSTRHSRVNVDHLRQAMTRIIGQSVATQLFQINTKPQIEGTSLRNPDSAAVVVAFVVKLVQQGVKPSAITVESPYKAQHRLYSKIFSDLHERYAEAGFDSIKVESFDTLQGREASIICVDMVIDAKIGCLKDSRLVNVAMTRAKDGLFVFANVDGAKANIKDIADRQLGKFIARFEELKRVHQLNTSEYIAYFETYCKGPKPVR